MALCGAGFASYFDVERFFADGALAHNFYHVWFLFMLWMFDGFWNYDI